VPAEYVPAVEKGVEEALTRGLLAGFPVVDVEVRLLDGQTHVRDSSGHAFEVAGSLCVQQIARDVGVQLLEPVMAVEVVSPAENLGALIGDLGARRG
jgi:elongation factor G